MASESLDTLPAQPARTPIAEDEYLLLDRHVFDRHLATVSTPDNTESLPPETNQSPRPALLRIPGSALLFMIPPYVYRAIERRCIYIGSQYPESLRCDLPSVRAAWSNWYPDELLSRIEAVSFNSTPKTRHQAWYAKAQNGKPTILYSGGNAESLLSIHRFLPLITEGYGFLNYEYPGYGSTKGIPNEKNLYQSIEAARNFLNQNQVPDMMQIGFGTSLGGGVTTDNAAKRPFRALILESTLTSIPDVIRYQIGRTLPRWMANLPRYAPSQFNSLEKISRIQSPLLIMHGTDDPLIPSKGAIALHQQAGTPPDQKTLTLFPVDIHNLPDTMTDPPIRLFLDPLFSRPEADRSEFS